MNAANYVHRRPMAVLATALAFIVTLFGFAGAAYANDTGLKASDTTELGSPLYAQAEAITPRSTHAVLKSDGYMYLANDDGSVFSETWQENVGLNTLSPAYEDVQVLMIDADVSSLTRNVKVKYKVPQGTVYDTSITLSSKLTNLHKVIFLLDSTGKNACASMDSSMFWNLSLIDEVGNFENTSIMTIPRTAFNGCKALVNIKIPDSVSNIENGAFQGCEKLSRVQFGEHVREIGDYAFSGCYLLGAGPATQGDTPLELPGSVISIGREAFKDCTALHTIIIHKTNGTVRAGYDFLKNSGIRDIFVFNYYLHNYSNNDSVGYFTSYKDNIHGWLGVSSINSVTYDGTEKTPPVNVTWMGESLDQQTNGKANYTVEYSNNVNAGEGWVKVVGQGDYKFIPEVDPDWSLYTTADFTISPRSMAGATITGVQDQTAGGSPSAAPVVTLDGKTLVANRDYELSYVTAESGLGASKVVATGIRNYTGSVEAPYTVTAPMTSLTYSGIGSGTYTGADQTPKPVVTLSVSGSTITLKEGQNYRVVMKDGKGNVVSKAVNAGTYKLTFIGIGGSFTGSAEKTFTIRPADISKQSFSSIGVKKYTGKAIKPGITVKFGSTKLAKGTDYELSYKNNKAKGHDAKVIVTGKGNFTGTKTVKFTINKFGKSRAEIAKAFAPKALGAYLLSGGKVVKPATLKAAQAYLKPGSKQLSKFKAYFKRLDLGHPGKYKYVDIVRNLTAASSGSNKVTVSMNCGSYVRTSYPSTVGAKWAYGSYGDYRWVFKFNSQDYVTSGTLYDSSGHVVKMYKTVYYKSGKTSTKSLGKVKF